VSHPLLAGLRHAVAVVQSLKAATDPNAPLASHSSLQYTIVIGRLGEEIERIESSSIPAPTADTAPAAVLDGGDDGARKHEAI